LATLPPIYMSSSSSSSSTIVFLENPFLSSFYRP